MRKLLTILLLSISSIVFAQEMSVKSFQLVETDLTANTPGTMVQDQNGNLCALIKLETSLDGFTFDVGSLGVREVKRVGGEIWVYVPFGTRRITLSHQQLGVIRDYPLPCAIERGRTYIMTIVAGTVRTIVEQASTKQFLQIEVTPSDAILEVNGKIKVVDNGVYHELLPFGKYQYKAYCKNYHDLIGVIEIADPDNTHRLNLKLNPAFGHISILEGNQADSKGAVVYIDEQYMGTIPLRNVQLNSGSHNIRVIKELYEAYNENVVINDEENLELKPNLTPDFAEVTLVTSEDAEIYINGDLKGKHTWKGKLVTGSYIFESKQKGHISTEQSYDISRANNNQQTIQLQRPIPIYGSLAISSTPSNAKIYIDGKQVGETPKYISKQIIGEYSVKIELAGYVSQTKRINITEGNESSLSFTLEKSKVNVEDSIKEEAIPFQLVEEKPSFQGGDANQFSKWVNSQLVYPEIAKDNGVQGRVTLQFTVMTDGTVAHVKVLRGVGPALDKEAVRVVSMSPKWKPGKQRDRAVPVTYTFPVIFALRTNHTPNSSVADRKIYSKYATIRVGEKVSAKLSDGTIDHWEASDYLVPNNDGTVTAKKEGVTVGWGYIKGSPKMFQFNILGLSANIPSDSPPYEVYSKKVTLKVGDHIIAKLQEGEVQTWEINDYNIDYISIDNNILTATKAGNITIWGRINGSPKLFEITIKN